jgi:uncharacterized protein YegP (UPF0339 family)
MATATKQTRTARRPKTDPLVFVVSEDNGGEYYWAIAAADGTTLAQSGAFASFADAEHAAIRVRDGAASASVEPRGAER